MEKIIVLLISIFSVAYGMAQSFAPVGAKWYYNAESEAPSPQHLIEDYYLMECVGDTIISGKTCRKIVGDNTVEYLYEDSNIVYYYQFNKFWKIYDFNLNVNDTVILDFRASLNEPLDTIIPLKAVVTNKSSVIVNGMSLEQFEVKVEIDTYYINAGYVFYNTRFSYYNIIGSTRQLITNVIGFPRTLEYEDPWLRCYHDSTLNFASPRWEMYNLPCDYRSLNMIKKSAIDILKLYPNPTQNVLYIYSESSENIQYSIIDITGKQIVTSILNDRTIDISYLSNGMYLLILKNNQEVIALWKFLKK